MRYTVLSQSLTKVELQFHTLRQQIRGFHFFVESFIEGELWLAY